MQSILDNIDHLRIERKCRYLDDNLSRGNKRISVLQKYGSTKKYQEVRRSTQKYVEVPRSPEKYAEVPRSTMNYLVVYV